VVLAATPPHPTTLAITLSRMGKYQETDTFRSETLWPQTGGSAEITEDDFLDTNNRAVDLFRKKKYPEAELLYCSVITFRERILGPEYPDTY
jgi:hypothetical protein